VLPVTVLLVVLRHFVEEGLQVVVIAIVDYAFNVFVGSLLLRVGLFKSFKEGHLELLHLFYLGRDKEDLVTLSFA